jgi:hypothetical protein
MFSIIYLIMEGKSYRIRFDELKPMEGARGVETRGRGRDLNGDACTSIVMGDGGRQRNPLVIEFVKGPARMIPGNEALRYILPEFGTNLLRGVLESLDAPYS